MPLTHRPVQRSLMRSEAFDVLRDAIVKGELAPGEQIKDTELAALLGLSRTPVREALGRLAESGLIESKPGVYTRVATLNRRDVEATLSVLRALDDLAVREGAPRLTSAHLAQLRSANKEFATAVRRKDIAAALGADDAFHGVFTRAAANPVLGRVTDQLHPQIHRILYRKFSTLLGGNDTIDHHQHLIDLCAAGETDEAARRSAAHWAKLGGQINQLFDDHQLEEGR